VLLVVFDHLSDLGGILFESKFDDKLELAQISLSVAVPHAQYLPWPKPDVSRPVNELFFCNGIFCGLNRVTLNSVACYQVLLSYVVLLPSGAGPSCNSALGWRLQFVCHAAGVPNVAGYCTSPSNGPHCDHNGTFTGSCADPQVSSFFCLIPNLK